MLTIAIPTDDRGAILCEAIAHLLVEHVLEAPRATC
jgi:hypothetical protein